MSNSCPTHSGICVLTYSSSGSFLDTFRVAVQTVTNRTTPAATAKHSHTHKPQHQRHTNTHTHTHTYRHMYAHTHAHTLVPCLQHHQIRILSEYVSLRLHYHTNRG